MYVVKKALQPPPINGRWDDPRWKRARIVRIDKFHPKTGKHRPRTRVKVLYDQAGLYVMFQVRDRYVRAVAKKHQDSVCKDSCVEFFVEPREGRGYFNFEINCGGTMLLYHVEDSTRVKSGFVKYRKVAPKWFKRIPIHPSLPKRVEPEITRPTVWTLSYFVPFALFEAYVGKLEPLGSRPWRCNFFKCGDKTSHPHWASWSSIGRELNFHQPKRFAPIRFET